MAGLPQEEKHQDSRSQSGYRTLPQGSSPARLREQGSPDITVELECAPLLPLQWNWNVPPLPLQWNWNVPPSSHYSGTGMWPPPPTTVELECGPLLPLQWNWNVPPSSNYSGIGMCPPFSHHTVELECGPLLPPHSGTGMWPPSPTTAVKLTYCHVRICTNKCFC